MLKSVLYFLLLLTTSVRFVDLIYLLAKDNTNLPIPVVIVSCIMVLYGIVLGVQKFIGSVRLRQLMNFFILQSGLIAFNMIYVSVATPLKMDAAEMLAVGTFLDLVVNGAVVYLSMRQMRSFQMPLVQEVAASGSRSGMNV